MNDPDYAMSEAVARDGYSMMCSGCKTPTAKQAAYVVPNWNLDKLDFFTAYRCGECIEKTIEDNWWSLQAMDEVMREGFCKFLERHGQFSDAAYLREHDLEKTPQLVESYMNALATRQIILSP